jgi:hypothetical protein
MCGGLQEEELSRLANALNWNGTSMALLKKKGTVTIHNYRAEKSESRITVSLGGRAEKASDGGKIQLNDFRPDDWSANDYGAVNNHSDVTWEVSLEPGQSRTFTYEASLYVH